VFYKVKAGHKQAMKEFSVKQFRQIDDLVMLVRSPLSSNDRKKFNTVLIIDVHARDIIDSFVRDSILDAREFQWESQLRSATTTTTTRLTTTTTTTITTTATITTVTTTTTTTPATAATTAQVSESGVRHRRHHS